MYNSRSRRPEIDPYGGPPPKRGRTSGFDTGRSSYGAPPPPRNVEPPYPSRYESRGYEPRGHEPLGPLGMHEGRHARDPGLLGTPTPRSRAPGPYVVDAISAQPVLLPGARRSSERGVVLPFPPGPRGPPHAGPLPPLPVVRCRGLPFQCNEGDVMEFFAGLDVLDVVLPRKEGRATGDAWVLLASPPQCELALQRTRLRMGRRYVEVFASQRQDYYRAIAQEAQTPREGQPAADSSRPTRGPPPGTGSRSKNDEPPAPSAKAPAPAPAPAADESVEASGAPAAEGEGADGKPGRKSSVLRLRGLPFAVTRMDVVEFFEDFNLSEARVHLLHSAEGQSTGEGFVEFHSPGEAAAAMFKDRSKMGSRYVELFPCSEEEAVKGIARASN